MFGRSPRLPSEQSYSLWWILMAQSSGFYTIGGRGWLP